MLSIHLNNVFFFAYHGLYDHETLNGNNFEVNLTVNYQPVKLVTKISETINYVAIYELLNARMQIATPLLETLVMDIANEILAQFPLVENISISIKKMQPPIANFDGSVGVSYSLKR
ncbi:MAG: dihydroneopterin aldolase [Pedobacter sp.]|nr:dihydroneopterin aldolase [Chitinophagaceae bacterium]